MKVTSTAAAYPGLPVIFAEGFSDYRKRLSGHSHVSLALTDVSEMVKTETTATITAAGIEFKLDEHTQQESRAAAVYNLIRSMLDMAVEQTGVSIVSKNHGIITGSSDSGAAALTWVLDDLLELNLPLYRMEELARPVSETAYRSIFGGLSEYLIDSSGNVSVTQLKKASFFSNMVIYAVPFDIKRFSADDLHMRVARHAKYRDRVDQVNIRIDELRRTVDERDLTGLMRLMELESRTVHTMFSEMGMEVIKPEMRDVIDSVLEMRAQGTDAYWNVAGGSCVYVTTLLKHAKEVTRTLKDADIRYRNLKVADGAKTVN